MDQELWQRIGTAITRAQGPEDVAESRAVFRSLWEDTAPSEHALRCVIAHYAADLETEPYAERAWDEAALDEFEAAPPESWSEVGIADSAGMLPSLHLNLADVIHRCGDADLARAHLTMAERHLDLLPDDAYGTTVRTGITGVRGRLDASVEGG